MSEETAKQKLNNMKAPRGGGGGSPLVKAAFRLIGGGLGLAVLGYNAIYTVPYGHKAVVFNRYSGLKEQSMKDGTHVCIPFLEWPILFDVRSRVRNITSLTGTKDLQMIDIGVRVLSKPHEGRLPSIYRTLGTEFDEVVLPSIVNEVCKQVIAQFNAAQLLTQREQVSRKIKQILTTRANEFSIELEDVSITELRFGREFTTAVEAKQVAQQNAERAKFHVDKALQDKRATIIRVQGDAKAAELIGSAIRERPGYLTLKRIQGAQKVAQGLARSQNKVFLDSNSLMLNVFGEVAQAGK